MNQQAVLQYLGCDRVELRGAAVAAAAAASAAVVAATVAGNGEWVLLVTLVTLEVRMIF